jgi:lipopolysaccharide export system protein LptC
MKKIIPLLTVILLLMTSAHAAWFSDDDKPKTTTAQDHKTYTLKLAEVIVAKPSGMRTCH